MPLEPASRDTCMVPAPGLGWDHLPANATCVIANVASENQKELCGRQALCPKCALGTSRVPIWRGCRLEQTCIATAAAESA